MDTFDHLPHGLSPDDTVAAFLARCNKGPDVLFVTESWFAPYKERLLSALPASLAAPLAEALTDALCKRRSLDTVVEFIEQQPMTWDEYSFWRKERDRQAAVELGRRGFFPWADVDAAEHDEELQRTHDWPSGRGPAFLSLAGSQEAAIEGRAACPGCGCASSKLKWFFFSSPPWTWERLCGRAGWIAVCKACHLQVDFILTEMN